VDPVLTDHHITEMQPDAHLDPPLARRGIAFSEHALNLDCAAGALERAGELDEEAVADRLDLPAAVFREDAVEERVMLVEQLQREGFILLRERAVADHVGEH
jgi:hypothetical protein